MSFIAETFIFLYVGMDALDIEKWKMTRASGKTSMGIYWTTILLVLLGRAAFIFPLSALSNYMCSNPEGPSITFRHQVFGFFTRPLITYLLPQHARNNNQRGQNTPKEDLTLPLFDFEESAGSNLVWTKPSLSLLLERPACTIHFYRRKFDDAYMRPIFGGPR